MLSICKYRNCNTTISVAGYCSVHKVKRVVNRSGWDRLDSAKTSQQKDFYNTNRWKLTSIRHRKKEPLCRECKHNKRIKIATMVHHEPDLNYLIANDLNPYDDKYLVSLCNEDHLKELRGKKTGIEKQTPMQKYNYYLQKLIGGRG